MPERREIMNKQMMNMEELEQVNGGNIFTDVWNWVCEKTIETGKRIVKDGPFVRPDILPPFDPIIADNGKDQ